jgi:hypothetical protein
VNVLYVLLGVLIGFVLAIVCLCGFRIGKLVICPNTEPGEPPLLFSELRRPVYTFERKKYVLMKLCHRNYLEDVSHE